MKNEKTPLHISPDLTTNLALVESLYKRGQIIIADGKIFFSERALAEMLNFCVRTIHDRLKDLAIDRWCLGKSRRRYYLEKDVLKAMEQKPGKRKTSK